MNVVAYWRVDAIDVDGICVAVAACAAISGVQGSQRGSDPTRVSPRKLKCDTRTHWALLKLQIVYRNNPILNLLMAVQNTN